LFHNQKILANIGFSVIEVEKEPTEARQKLYTWMLGHGYAVTTSMTLIQLINMLVGGAVAKYIIRNENLYIEDNQATIVGGNLNLKNGATIVNGNLILTDTE